LNRPRVLCLRLAVLVLAAVTVGCGGPQNDRVVVRIGRNDVLEADVARQMSVIAPDHAIPDAPLYKRCTAALAVQTLRSIAARLEQECRRQYEELKQRALEFLISSDWLIAEAGARGLEFSGATLGAEARAAEAKLSRALTGNEAKISQAQVTRYYRQHAAHFESRERRDIDIVEPFSSKAAARRAMRQADHKGNIAKVALRESYSRPNIADIVPAKRTIMRAIFAAPPHALVGPIPLLRFWCFFEVTRVVPGAVKPLAQVRGAIEQQLAAEQQRGTLARFIRAWRQKWIERTSCSPGYVVQKCRQYRGLKAPEDPVAFN
jgi:foldase protein PrsA